MPVCACRPSRIYVNTRGNKMGWAELLMFQDGTFHPDPSSFPNLAKVPSNFGLRALVQIFLLSANARVVRGQTRVDILTRDPDPLYKQMQTSKHRFISGWWIALYGIYPLVCGPSRPSMVLWLVAEGMWYRLRRHLDRRLCKWVQSHNS